MLTDLFRRLGGRYRRAASGFFARRPCPLHLAAPLISFTFDDFPRSALFTAGSLLVRQGAVGTYYAAFGLMGKSAPTGRIFDRADLAPLLEQGHELGCHTFDHHPAWTTPPEVFEKSVQENQRVLSELVPGYRLQTLSYPIEEPLPVTKRLMARHFACCRAGGQKSNVGTLDRNALSAYFLDQRNRDRFAEVSRLITANQRARGWLIFATHDVCPDPTPYGCTERFFAQLLECSLQSGARIVSVAAAWKLIQESRNSGSRAGGVAGAFGWSGPGQ